MPDHIDKKTIKLNPKKNTTTFSACFLLTTQYEMREIVLCPVDQLHKFLFNNETLFSITLSIMFSYIMRENEIDKKKDKPTNITAKYSYSN